MCRILLSVGGRPSGFFKSFIEISKRDRTMGWSHGSGWGALWASREGFGVYKSLRPIWESFVEPPVGYSLYLLHSRLASVGRVAFENTHPIVYGRYAISHNGTLDKERFLAELERRGVEVGDVAGETDSEVLLKAIVKMGADEDAVKEIAEAARQFIDPQEPLLNFAFIDGGGNAYFYTYRKSEHPHYVPVYAELGDVFLIASEPLGGGAEWKTLKNGELLTLTY
ncbi:MAG: class II glutamine amidotransferase [Pyrobaculum sp.]|jgi:glutamine amidotransferase